MSLEKQIAKNQESASQVMHLLTRQAMANAVLGRARAEFTFDICRLVAARCEVGQKYHNFRFQTVVEHSGKTLSQRIIAVKVATPLPGLGIRSALGLIFDGVTIGGSTSFQTHESLMMIGVNHIDATTGRRIASMLDAPSAGMDHRGKALKELVLNTLANHPAELTRALLVRILAGIGVDGNLTTGGPEARHQSSGAAEMIWHEVTIDLRLHS